MRTSNARRAFTLTELVTVLVIIGGALFGIRIPTGASVRQARTLQCQNQVRGIVQAMQVFADNNNGSYPLPSLLDRTGTTIGPPIPNPTNNQLEVKNNLGNTLSILIFNHAITPEMCVTPAEVSSAVRVDTGYEYSNPVRAGSAGGTPQTALWDPGFAGTPLTGEPFYRRAFGISNNSYTSIAYFGARRAMWSNTHNATEPVFGNRGPKYQPTSGSDQAPWNGNGSNGWRLVFGSLGTTSNTLRIHGGPTSWEGNIAYNDGHVKTERRPDPEAVTFRRYGTQTSNQYVPDNLFVDETDDATGGPSNDFNLRQNAWLRPVATITASGTSLTYNLWVD